MQLFSNVINLKSRVAVFIHQILTCYCFQSNCFSKNRQNTAASTCRSTDRKGKRFTKEAGTLGPTVFAMRRPSPHTSKIGVGVGVFIRGGAR